MTRNHLFCVAAVLLLTGTVDADLMVYEYVPGELVTWDSFTGNHWYSSLPDFTGQTYATLAANIAALGTYGNIDGGWRLATQSEIEALFTNSPAAIAASFARTNWAAFGNISWHGRTAVALEVGTHQSAVVVYDIFRGTYRLEPDAGAIPDSFQASYIGAWVTSSAPVVPVPSAVILGTIGLGFSGWLLRKQQGNIRN
ncbi:MAG: hypothetical protein ACYS19_05235 [Planctomycetota bacterium]|jgi:hypothetical protein